MPATRVRDRRDEQVVDLFISGNPYRLYVFGHGLEQVVEHLGGWIFDRSTAGWAVTLRVADTGRCSDAPARVLGARVVASETPTQLMDTHPATVASPTGYFGRDAAASPDRGPSGSRLEQVTYRPTRAALAFKAAAIATYRPHTPDLTTTETFVIATIRPRSADRLTSGDARTAHIG
jgi:hypothetical protein